MTDKKEYPFFDLEQNIMECWGIKEDLELLYSNTDGIDEDELQNALLGMIQLTEWRFQKLFNSFEKAMKSRGDKQ